MLVNSTLTAPVLVNKEPLKYVEELTYSNSLINEDGEVQDIKTS